jgi:nucleobase:cation symporter-1, NCS1 family
MIGFWSTLSLNVPDFTRYGKSQRVQMLGQTIGLPSAMLTFSAIGVVITSATKEVLPHVPVNELWDPVFVLS